MWIHAHSYDTTTVTFRGDSWGASSADLFLLRKGKKPPRPPPEQRRVEYPKDDGWEIKHYKKTYGKPQLLERGEKKDLWIRYVTETGWSEWIPRTRAELLKRRKIL